MGMAGACQAARIMQELDMEWERLALEHFGGDLECADTQARSLPPLRSKDLKLNHTFRGCDDARGSAGLWPSAHHQGKVECAASMPDAFFVAPTERVCGQNCRLCQPVCTTLCGDGHALRL